MIKGFSISQYKSFAIDPTHIGPLTKINLFIGQNNSGKSNIISFLMERYSLLLSSALGQGQNIPPLDLLDAHQGESDWKTRFSIGVDFQSADLKKYLDSLQSRPGYLLRKHIEIYKTEEDTCYALIPFEPESINSSQHIKIAYEFLTEAIRKSHLSETDWAELVLMVNGNVGGLLQERLKHVYQNILISTLSRKKVYLLQAIRSIDDRNVFKDIFQGQSLIEKLAQLQNPPHNQQNLREEFIKITKFARDVLEDQNVTLEIPFPRDTISVHMNSKVLPIKYLGTGIHEVIMMAAAATVIKDSIVCIEEVESHLHPLLQKKLIQYLRESTTNQYFITTHSAHLLDFSSASIFHVSYDGQKSAVSKVIKEKDLFAICRDLGYKASDLLQSNCVIWVEGPSDRIYLNYWISKINPTVKEGIHYSIMFFGGKLFSHLTFEDDELVEDYIRLLKINRNSAILFDSDKKNRTGEMTSTKKRLVAEMEAIGGFLWVTNGKEIENYFPLKTVLEAVKKIHPSFESSNSKNIFSNCLEFKNKDGKFRVADKIKVARELISLNLPIDEFDLKQKVSELVDFIGKANLIRPESKETNTAPIT